MNPRTPFRGHRGDVDEVTPVLVVGGGLSGLSTALFLGSLGVRPLLVEKHAGLLMHPRARGFTQRTIEIFRQIGLEPAIRKEGFADGDVFRWVAVTAGTLAGDHTPVPEPEDTAETLAGLSPAPFAPIDQDRLEIILRYRAAELGSDLRFATELLSLTQDDDGVLALLRDHQTGREYSVRARYLVAADGWDSPVRQHLGVALDGPGPFFHVVTAMIDADLTAALGGRQVSIAYLNQPRQGTVLMAHDPHGKRWVFATGYSPEHGESVADFTDARIVAMVRAAAGLPDVAVTLRPQIPNTDLKVLGFAIGAQVAREYRAGNVFLVGDAAHIVPPTGGLGANTGIQDAHNLAWKLAFVLLGRADSGLLDTYHQERHPVGMLTMGQSLARWSTRVGASDAGSSAALLNYASIAFGYRYQSRAVIGGLAESAPVLPPSEMRGQPGTRAPHVWLGEGEDRMSTIDLFGHDFVLLAGERGHRWIDGAEAIQDPFVTGFRIGAGAEGTDAASDFAAAYDIAASGAVLVRPDGFVAWREENDVADPAAALRDALARLLGDPATSLAERSGASSVLLETATVGVTTARDPRHGG